MQDTGQMDGRSETKVTITDAGAVSPNENSLTIWIKTDIGQAIEFSPASPDRLLADRGMAVLDGLCLACSMVRPDDTSEFIGKTMSLVEWRRIFEGTQPRTAARRHRKVRTANGAAKFVYVIAAETDPPICKIGIAANPESRLKTLSTASPHKLRIATALHFRNPILVESDAHAFFAPYRLNGEWFQVNHQAAVDYVEAAKERVA